MSARSWRAALWVGGELQPFDAEVDWQAKRLSLMDVSLPVAENSVFKAVFPDPNNHYVLVRVILEVVDLDRDSEDKSYINRVDFRFYHRKG